MSWAKPARPVSSVPGPSGWSCRQLRSRLRVPTPNSGAAVSENSPEFADGRTQPGSVQSSPGRTSTLPVTASVGPAPARADRTTSPAAAATILRRTRSPFTVRASACAFPFENHVHLSGVSTEGQSVTGVPDRASVVAALPFSLTRGPVPRRHSKADLADRFTHPGIGAAEKPTAILPRLIGRAPLGAPRDRAAGRPCRGRPGRRERACETDRRDGGARGGRSLPWSRIGCPRRRA